MGKGKDERKMEFISMNDINFICFGLEKENDYVKYWKFKGYMCNN